MLAAWASDGGSTPGQRSLRLRGELRPAQWFLRQQRPTGVEQLFQIDGLELPGERASAEAAFARRPCQPTRVAPSRVA